MSKLKGVEALMRQLAELRDLPEQVVRPELVKQAKGLAAKIEANAPRESGRLAHSVEIVDGPRKRNRVTVSVEVSGGHDRAVVGHVELGTREHAANPFIRRSADAKRGEILRGIEGAVGRGIGG